jgi:hypothetical protein
MTAPIDQMKYSQPMRRYVWFLGLISSLLFHAPLQAEDFDSLIARARQQAQAEQFLDCLATAQDAVKADPQNYKGYYYAALALYRDDKLEEAQPFLEQARAKAGSESQATVGKLAEAIGYRRTALVEIKAGDDAMNDGLAGKAAQAYQRAWEAGRLNPAIGLKAANLYAERLNAPLAAAQILRQILDKFPNSKPGEDAAGLLAKLGPVLATTAQAYLQQAGRAEHDNKKSLLEKAVAADPNLTPAYFSLASLAAQDNDSSEMYVALRELAKRGALDVPRLSAAGFERFYGEDAFQQFVRDALGEAALQEVKGLVEAEIQKQRRQQAEHERPYQVVKVLQENAIRQSVGHWELAGDSPKGFLTIERTDAGKLSCSGQISYKYNKSQKRETLKVTGASELSMWCQGKQETLAEAISNGAVPLWDLSLFRPTFKVELYGDFHLAIAKANPVMLQLSTVETASGEEVLSIECGKLPDTDNLVLRRVVKQP